MFQTLASITSSSSTSTAAWQRLANTTGVRAFASDGAVIPFNLADIGEGIAEVEVMEWFVASGDAISQFDKVCLVQSDKATVEITSRFDGVVESLAYDVGGMAAVGDPLMHIRTDDPSALAEASQPSVADDATSAPASTSAPSSSPSSSPAAAASSSPPAGSFEPSNAKVLASPAVRRMAREHNIDLTLVPATGKQNHITKSDMIAFMDGGGASAAPVASSAAPGVTGVGTPEDRTESISGIRRIMVQTMERANQIPALGYGDEVVMNQLVSLRAQLKPMAEAQDIKLSFLPFIVKACSLSLTRFPLMNSVVNDACTEITFKGAHNIGVAMDTPRGLMVPVIKNVQNLSILEIAAEMNRLAKLGQDGMLGAADLSDGTFSISNVGSIGGTYVNPIIVAPQVAITALGKFQKVPRYDADDNVYPATVMVMSTSADHRVVDGATVAQFINSWKGFLEEPTMMLASMK